MAETFHFGQAQLGFNLGEPAAKKGYEPDLAEIRSELKAILESAKSVSADALWDQRTYKYNKVIFPQMSRWLPKDEADQLCFAFHTEIERIEQLLAA